MVWGLPPTPSPDSRNPAKGIQSTRKAVWSFDHDRRSRQPAATPQRRIEVAGERRLLERRRAASWPCAIASSRHRTRRRRPPGQTPRSVITRASSGGSRMHGGGIATGRDGPAAAHQRPLRASTASAPTPSTRSTSRWRIRGRRRCPARSDRPPSMPGPTPQAARPAGGQAGRWANTRCTDTHTCPA